MTSSWNESKHPRASGGQFAAKGPSAEADGVELSPHASTRGTFTPLPKPAAKAASGAARAGRQAGSVKEDRTRMVAGIHDDADALARDGETVPGDFSLGRVARTGECHAVRRRLVEHGLTEEKAERHAAPIARAAAVSKWYRAGGGDAMRAAVEHRDNLTGYSRAVDDLVAVEPNGKSAQPEVSYGYDGTTTTTSRGRVDHDAWAARNADAWDQKCEDLVADAFGHRDRIRVKGDL